MTLGYLITGERGTALARLGFTAGVVGVSVLVVGISIDGFAGKQLADTWAAAPATEEVDALRVSEAIELVHNGLFTVWIFLLA